MSTTYVQLDNIRGTIIRRDKRVLVTKDNKHIPVDDVVLCDAEIDFHAFYNDRLVQVRYNNWTVLSEDKLYIGKNSRGTLVSGTSIKHWTDNTILIRTPEFEKRACEALGKGACHFKFPITDSYAQQLVARGVSNVSYLKILTLKELEICVVWFQEQKDMGWRESRLYKDTRSWLEIRRNQHSIF